jgi:hypothetical protein
MEGAGIFYGDLLHFTAICNILWPFGIIFGDLVIWCALVRKIWQPWIANSDFFLCVLEQRSFACS